MDASTPTFPSAIIEDPLPGQTDIPILNPAVPYVAAPKPKSAPVFIAIPVLILGILGFLVNQYLNSIGSTDYRSNASEDKAIYTILPSSLTLPPDKTVKVMLNTGSKKVGFVRTEISFNPKIVQIAKDATVGNNFQTIIAQTKRTEANKTGKYFLTLGVAPGMAKAAPSGMMELVQLQFTSVSGAPIPNTDVTVLPSSQVVTMDAVPMTLSINKSIIMVPSDGTFTDNNETSPPASPCMTWGNLFGFFKTLTDRASGQNLEYDANNDGKVSFNDVFPLIKFISQRCSL